MIIGVAIILRNGTTICLPNPNRHSDVIHHAVKFLGIIPENSMIFKEQGFYTEKGVYLNRKEALAEAICCKQEIIELDGISVDKMKYLFSENLW